MAAPAAERTTRASELTDELVRQARDRYANGSAAAYTRYVLAFSGVAAAGALVAAGRPAVRSGAFRRPGRPVRRRLAGRVRGRQRLRDPDRADPRAHALR